MPRPIHLVATGENDEPGINGGLMPRSHPGATTVNTIGVPSLDASLKAVESRGGRIVVPKMAVPRIGWLAYCADTEGNTFGLLQPDEAAT